MKFLHYTKSLSVCLTPEHYQKIQEIAEQKRIPMSEWFRNIAVKELDLCHQEGGKK